VGEVKYHSPMESGGYATVWSMRFQHLWAVRQLLLLLAEELRSVRIEPAGIEGEGLDLIVLLPDERREFQQCKRSYRNTGKWTLRALEVEGVLRTIGSRLREDREASFRLVSLDSAPDLRELSDAARASLDPVSFYRDQIKASQQRGRAFDDFCRAVQIDGHRPKDIAEARDLLARTFTELTGDDDGALRDLRSIARYWIDGDAGAAVAALESFAQKSLRLPLTTDDVERHLRSMGFQSRALVRDPRIHPSIRQLRGRFESSLSTQLIGGQLLPRDEATLLMQFVTDDLAPRFMVLHGPAGVGKSGVLLDFTRRLSRQGISFLPIRLDRQRPSGTTRHFGQSLGLPDSPALCLHALSCRRRAILVLDQLDALRWTGGDAAAALETCRELVSESLRYPNLRVVACCRTFDLETDPQIRGWIEHDEARRVCVERLSEETVQQIVFSSGTDHGTLSSRQLDLLRTIQHLRAWEEIIKICDGPVEFHSGPELIDQFWKTRLQEAQRMGLEPSAVQRATNRIVDFMDKQGTLVAPQRLLRGKPDIENALCSLNVISMSDGDLSFCHQIYLDHQLAHLLLRRFDEGETTLEDWLTGSHQGLYRREQLRLVLAMLREERFDDYLREVQQLLSSGDVRFHLKQVILEFLGGVVDPHQGERQLALQLLNDEQWREHVVLDVLYGHPRWFEIADEYGIIADWLRGDDHTRDRALGLIRSVVEELGDRCQTHLASLAKQGEEGARQAASALPTAPAADSPSLFELRLKLAEGGLGDAYLDWSGLGGKNLPRLVRLLSSILRRQNDGQQNRILERSNEPDLQGISEIDFKENSFSDLRAAWDELLLLAAKVLGHRIDEDQVDLIEHSSWRSDLRELLRRLAAGLLARDAQAAMDCSDVNANPLADLLILEALSQVDELPVADRAIKWLMAKPSRLRQRWTRSNLPWEVAKRTTEQLTRQCSAEACASFEHFLLEHRDRRLGNSLRRRHKWLLSPRDEEPRFAKAVLARPSPEGETAFHLISTIPSNRRSRAGTRRFQELQRKFEGVGEIYFSGRGKVQGGWVGSPLPTDRLSSLSDRTWLRIIQNNSVNRPGTSRYRDNRIEESTPETFSSDLQSASAREPGRFARLALRLPPKANPLYIRAIISGLRAESRKKEAIEDATVVELEAILALPQVKQDISLAKDLAWLVDSRADLDWGPSTVSAIAEIATAHPDPAPEELHVLGGGWEKWGPESLVTNALNCSRGAATFAIAKLVLAHPRLLPDLVEAIGRIVTDPHPAVRAAVFACCLATLRHDSEAANTWALRAAEGHEALLACSTFDRFLRFACGRHPERMEKMLLRMLTSPRDDVVFVASRHATALYLVHGQMEEVITEFTRGIVPQRRGAAQVAAALMDRREYHQNARAILVELMDDDSDEVLSECAEAFRDTSMDLFAEAPDFLEAYASSRAFIQQPTLLLRRLHDYTGSLVPFAHCVLSVCRSLSESHGNNVEQNRQRSWGADHYLPPILLRLYDQASNESKVRELCLDAWDNLLRSRVVSAFSLMRKLEDG